MPKARIKMILWLVAVVSALFAGMAVQRRLDEPTIESGLIAGSLTTRIEHIEMPDKSRWYRFVDDTEE